MISVGIDIGTSTTSMIVSRLNVKNTASGFTVPKITIAGSEILYRGEIYQTPLKDSSHIDVDQVAGLIREEYRKAGISPEQVQTGAVIITGESSRKENSALVTERMSSLAGEFVVAAAGPDLESVIAAKGAGIHQYSEEHTCTAANLDIGGGTSNLAVFTRGELAGKGCWDIGGRLVRVEGGRITYLSGSVRRILDSLGLKLETGYPVEEGSLRQVTDVMAGVLAQALGLEKAGPLYRELYTPGASPYVPGRPIRYISFSGGVAQYIYHPSKDWFQHGDTGPLLADSIRRNPLFSQVEILMPRETIRATVIGAGAHTTMVSGSTIFYTREDLFPIKNVPVFFPGPKAAEDISQGDGRRLYEEMCWYLEETGADNLMVWCGQYLSPTYSQLQNMAEAMTWISHGLGDGLPVLILAGADFAKALGQAVKRRLPGREIICIDGVPVSGGDYLDLGRPMEGGITIPVVVKTLIFG